MIAQRLPEAAERVAGDGIERIFVVHQFKTGGTSLFTALERALPPEALYPNPDDGEPIYARPQADIGRLVDGWCQRAERIRVITGHFPLVVASILGVELTLVTVLRDPVERVLSHLRQQQDVAPDFAGWSLEEIYDHEAYRTQFLQNHMVWMLTAEGAPAFSGNLRAVGTTQADTARAIGALDRFALIGLVEDYERFWYAFARRFGIDLGPVVRNNWTPPRAVSPALLERIEADNSGDRALYEAARAHPSRAR